MPSLIAVVGLLVTLVFNTMGVWQGVEADKQARDTEQVRLMTQLNTQAIDTERAINATDAPDNRCKPYRIDTLKDNEQAAVFAAFDFYEYLAWLFNTDRLTIASAREYWAPNMIDAYSLGTTYFARADIEERFPELTRFRRRTERSLWPPDPCA